MSGGHSYEIISSFPFALHLFAIVICGTFVRFFVIADDPEFFCSSAERGLVQGILCGLGSAELGIESLVHEFQ
jgi:hypothetical protein